MNDVGRRIAENLAAVQGRVAKAAAASRRPAEAVTLVAVTKYASEQLAAALVQAGCVDLGESRPQELWTKAAALAGATGVSPVRWHLVGHLQRNKIRRTLPQLHLLHSVDSGRLLIALDNEAKLLDRVVNVLVEVNASRDATKTGLPPEEVEPLLAGAASLSHVCVRGLMGMASLDGGAAAAHRDFSCLRELRDKLSKNLPTTVSLAELSMGMSEDFEIAIAEGATIVRVGSALFEGIEK